MTDREKVIRGLEVCIEADFTEGKNPCAPCPYFFEGMCHHLIMKGALELLKEQEPIRRSEMYFCGDCKTAIARTMNYCHKCGRKVKWDA